MKFDVSLIVLLHKTNKKEFDSLIFRFQSTKAAYTDIRERVSNLNANFQHHFKDFSIYNTLYVHDKGIQDAVRVT